MGEAGGTANPPKEWCTNIFLFFSSLPLDNDDIQGILRIHGTKPVSKRSYLRLTAIRYYGPAIGNACGVQLPSDRGRTNRGTARWHEPLPQSQTACYGGEAGSEVDGQAEGRGGSTLLTTQSESIRPSQYKPREFMRRNQIGITYLTQTGLYVKPSTNLWGMASSSR